MNQPEDSSEPDELDANEDFSLEDISLEDLGAAYARAAAKHQPETFVEPAPDTELESDLEPADPPEGSKDDEPDDAIHPAGVIEAALFVGHPENKPMTAGMLASMMRDVTEDEINELADELNESYKAAGQALRIVTEETGLKMTIAPAVETVRQSFLGKVREARLSQAAIEVLALVAYQPGVTGQTVQDQRGKESGSLLNQLVRRRLIEMRRVAPPEGGRKVPQYYPSERFLMLFGLETLEDLPLVDEGFFGG
ncbi:MAG: SMC-Scp complex subunit ScpB [Planctomycetota bacterium]